MALEEQQRGTDLRATLAISMTEALAGTSRALTLPGRRQVNVFVPAGTRDGRVIRLEGLGDLSSSGGPPGALILTIAIQQPDPNLQQPVHSPSFSQLPTSNPPGVPLPLPSARGQIIPPPPPTSRGISTAPPSRSQGKVILLVGLALLVIVGSASIFVVRNNQIATDRAHATAIAQVNATATAQVFDNPAATTNICPDGLSQMQSCQTPHSLRVAYGVESLVEHGFTGKGQTIIEIESFGSSTLQQDVDEFDRQFGLPPIKIQVISPLGTAPIYYSNLNIGGWASGTTQDVEIMHAIAPDAGIVVLTSPVAETQGTIGLPEFRQLIQYAIDHHLGNIISTGGWGASEAPLKDPAGQQEIQKWDALLRKATTQQGITFFASTGVNGATDYADLQSTTLSPTPTIEFPSDEPWVTSVGGTTLNKGQSAQENAWSSSGGGFSAFYPTPSYQETLPASVQSLFKHRRGVPDVSADADSSTGMAYYFNGLWQQAGSTAASTALWAALGAIANQMAGHPLGFINPGLYKVAESSLYTQAFHDITVGNNDVNNGVKVKGYAAVPGWDPVTGWGSPNAEVLLP